jgi:CRP-like cAMP-binding protein/Fe-S-cluster-containing hydrogenase component 2
VALLESIAEHRPTFQTGAAGGVRQLTVPPEQQLAYFTQLPLFNRILDEHYETRPGVGKPRRVLVKEALSEHSEFYEVPAGTVVFTEGSFGEHLYILIRGAARSTTSFALDAERVAKVPIEDMTDGDFFGEHSALSMGAHLISVETTAPSLLLLIPQFIAQALTKDQESFRSVIMQRYVSRAVRTLIRRIPMLRFSSEDEFTRLLATAELKRFEIGQVFFEEGDEPDDLYIIHDGFVKLSKQSRGTTQVLSYLVEGDCFGEVGALSGAARQATATAMSGVEALTIAGSDFQAIVMNNPLAASEAVALENVQRLDADMIQNVTFIGRKLEFQAEVMPNLDVIAIDQNLCVRCDNCVTACAAAHDDGFSRLIRKGVTFGETLLPTACRSCADPACLLCKSGGIKRDKDGDIYFTDSCIGCSGCAQRCPYGNITMVDTDEIGKPPVPTLVSMLLSRTSRDTPVPEASDKRPKLKKIPVKCDLDKGHLFPACVSNCPTGAIKRYRADELDQIMGVAT